MAPVFTKKSSLFHNLMRGSVEGVVVVVLLLSMAGVSAVGGSRVKLYFSSKRYNSSMFIEAKDSTVLFCNTPDCEDIPSSASIPHMASLNFDSWQEYTSLGFPIATSNKYEQIHSIYGFHNLRVDPESKRDQSLLCKEKHFYKDTQRQCKGLSFQSQVCPKLVDSNAISSMSAMSVLLVTLDLTVMKQGGEGAKFTFRDTPKYDIQLRPLDVIVQLSVTGWTFCNLGSVECPVTIESSNATHLLFTLDFKLDSSRPRLAGETNHYKKYSLGSGACLILGKFYHRRHPEQVYSPQAAAATDEYVYVNDAPMPPGTEGVQFLMADFPLFHPAAKQSPSWKKQPSGYPSTDYNSKFVFYMEQTQNLYDESLYEIIYRPPSRGTSLPRSC